MSPPRKSNDDLEKRVRERTIDLTNANMILKTQIEERKKAEEMLRKSEERYRLLTENASEAILTIDEESRIGFANRAAERLFGYTNGEMLGHELTMLMPEHLHTRHREGLKRYLGTGRQQVKWDGIEFTGRHKNGNDIQLEISFTEFKDNSRSVFTGIVRDVTERKQHEEALQDSLERLRTLHVLGQTVLARTDNAEELLHLAAEKMLSLLRASTTLITLVDGNSSLRYAARRRLRTLISGKRTRIWRLSGTGYSYNPPDDLQRSYAGRLGCARYWRED